ncbi:MAG: hypothetical protein ACR2J7_01455 [Luteimonas sp.]
MRLTLLLLGCLAAPGMAMAQIEDCASIAPAQTPSSRPTILMPVAAELSAPTYHLGIQSGVLAHAYDESQSVDQVLRRIRIDSCRAVAMTTPAPSLIDPKDPSVYKPKTEFDNTPWRFDMNQNGKRMTADEFDAWMKSRGVRVARGALPAAAPVASEPMLDPPATNVPAEAVSVPPMGSDPAP